MTTLFKRVGRRYHPVSKVEAMDALPVGHWHIHITKDGCRCTSTIEVVDPAPIWPHLAALQELKNWLVGALSEASKATPGRGESPLTAKQKKAYEAYAAICDEPVWFTTPSLNDIADKAIAFVREKAKGKSLADDLSWRLANKVYDILVNAGACPTFRDAFTIWFREDEHIAGKEWRFKGKLGFGGKFRRHRQPWYVDYYPEDKTPERDEVVNVSNLALLSLCTAFGLYDCDG